MMVSFGTQQWQWSMISADFPAQLGIPDFALVWMTPLCIILRLFDKIQFYSSRIENRLLPPDINSCLHSCFFVVSQTLAPLSFLAPLFLWKLDPAGTKGFLSWFNFSLWNDCFPWRRLQLRMKEMMRNQIGCFWGNLFMWCYDCSSCYVIIRRVITRCLHHKSLLPS